MRGAAFERERSFSIGMASPYVSVLCEFACKSVAKNTLRTRRPLRWVLGFIRVYPRKSAAKTYSAAPLPWVLDLSVGVARLTSVLCDVGCGWMRVNPWRRILCVLGALCV